MRIYIFGNGNISFRDFEQFYRKPLESFLIDENNEFIVCDYRGTDTLVMELLKNYTSKVTILHIGEKPRYFPDIYKTKVQRWRINGGFQSDGDRDLEAIRNCTHFLAKDFNSNNRRKSSTQMNIEKCIKMGKINLTTVID